MTVKFGNRVKHTLVGTAGTGDLTFGPAVSGFQTFSDAAYVAGDVCHYTIENGTQYEIGTGTITVAAGVFGMSRVVIETSENGNAALVVPASATCFVTVLAQDVVQNLPNLLDVATTVPNAGQVLAYDSGTALWTPTTPAGGIPTVSDQAELAAYTGMLEKSFIWVNDSKSLYIYDGTEWDRVSTGSQFAPRFTTAPPATLTLESDGTTSTLTVVAVDDVGFPITYDWDAFDASNTVYSAGTLPNMLTAVAENSGVFTLTPSTNASHAGNLTFRSKASDGVATVMGLTTLELTFSAAIVIDTGGNHNGNTFSANSSTGYVVYNGNSTATSSSYMSYSPLTKLNEGKKYIEVEIGVRALHQFFGIGDLAIAAAGNMGYSDTGNTHSTVYFNNGRIYPSNTAANIGATGGRLYENDIMMIAWDTTTKEVWWGKNGSWGTATGAPGGSGTAESLSGVNFTTGLTFIFGQSSAGTTTLQFVSGPGSTLNYTVPTGFQAY